MPTVTLDDFAGHVEHRLLHAFIEQVVMGCQAALATVGFEPAEPTGPDQLNSPRFGIGPLTERFEFGKWTRKFERWNKGEALSIEHAQQ